VKWEAEAEVDLRAAVRAYFVGHRPRPRSPPPADSASTVRRLRRGGVPPLRRDGHRPRSPAAAAAASSPTLERLAPSVRRPRRIPAAGASSSPRRMLLRRRCGGRGVEERVGSGVGVVLLSLQEDVVAAGAGRGARR
jgi:hypothetical protein